LQITLKFAETKLVVVKPANGIKLLQSHYSLTSAMLRTLMLRILASPFSSKRIAFGVVFANAIDVIFFAQGKRNCTLTTSFLDWRPMSKLL